MADLETDLDLKVYLERIAAEINEHSPTFLAYVSSSRNLPRLVTMHKSSLPD